MFKKALLILVVGVFLLAPGFAQNKALDFTLHNKTGADIHSIHLSPSDKDTWEENILKADDVLEDGESVHIQFSPHETAELWDLKVGDITGTGLVWENLKLTTIHDLTLKIVDGKPIAEIK
jgi:hypothetical protein